MKKLLLFLALAIGASAQTVPASPGIFSLTVSGGRSGSGTVGPGTTNTVAKFTASTTVGDSLLTDDGTTLTYTGTGGIALNSGSAAGVLKLTQGTAPSTGTTNISIAAPASVTSYIRLLPGAVGSTGLLLETVSGSTQTESLVTALPNGFTATTQTAGSNDTKVATDAYADTATRATHLGTFASPNTAAGAITWTAPVYNIYTSAASTRTYTLPAASSYTGQAFILNVAVGTGHVNVQPASGAQLVLAGVLLTADHYVQAATSAPGNYICFISDGTNWTSLGSSGTWADAASP
jgi:hypothetical protein